MSRLIDADALIKTLGIGDLPIRLTYEINHAPTVEAEPRWIPCSERLPENMEPVNITWENRDPVPY